MTALVTAVVSWLGLVVASNVGGTASTGAWVKLYSVPARGEWLTSVWQKGDRSWLAGGKDLIVSGNAEGIRTRDISGFVVYAFGEDSSGGVVAVGSRQAIWQERGDELIRVHERLGPPLKGRAAYGDILEGLGYLDPSNPDRFVAYGSLHLALTRDSNKAWQVSDDDGLARRGSLGPVLNPPKGCHTAGWHWLTRTDGFLSCHEGQAYVYSGTDVKPVGRLPKPCLSATVAAARDGHTVFVACGEKARLWRREGDASTWSEILGVSDVRALNARDGCLLVAAGRSVLRQCDSGTAKSDGRGASSGRR